MKFKHIASSLLLLLATNVVLAQVGGHFAEALGPEANAEAQGTRILEWVWFFAFLCTGVATMFAFSALPDECCCSTGSLGAMFLVAIVSTCAAVVVSWPVLGGVAWEWLDRSLPQRGTAIHDWTLFVVGGLPWFGVVCAVLLCSSSLGSHWARMRAGLREARAPS